MKNKNKTTKFPVARIKKIMQKDEEVGKVAQATPIVISKALELFLGLIIEESYKVTAERGAKKVEAYHLKHAVDTVETLDFLKEIVAAVPDPSAGGTIDLEAEGAAKRRGKGRKVAAASSSGATGAEPTKRRRKKKAVPDQGQPEQEEPSADPGTEPEQGDDHDQEEDAEMNEYDEDDDDAPHNGSKRARRSSSDDDGWDGGKPYVPGR
ncbi:histone-fold-containing protein [Coprinopsis marcescibilis]|uniref:Histone-fold-containing protein n=1 Tax=Coprinopsis marcescibilis TaxID=230819 RepID=A0A5C3KN53_COPMA|nr:histone-fold-containing protein [Coprinopsis marcescibilis]